MEGMAAWMILGIIPLGLLIAMVMSRNPLLGFPAALFWAIFGGYAYTQSAIPWGDWQYYVAFGSLAGMVPFSALAAYALREKKDTLYDEETEDGENAKGNGHKTDDVFETYIDEQEVKPSRKAVAVRERARKRRSELW